MYARDDVLDSYICPKNHTNNAFVLTSTPLPGTILLDFAYI